MHGIPPPLDLWTLPRAPKNHWWVGSVYLSSQLAAAQLTIQAAHLNADHIPTSYQLRLMVQKSGDHQLMDFWLPSTVVQILGDANPLGSNRFCHGKRHHKESGGNHGYTHGPWSFTLWELMATFSHGASFWVSVVLRFEVLQCAKKRTWNHFSSLWSFTVSL